MAKISNYITKLKALASNTAILYAVIAGLIILFVFR